MKTTLIGGRNWRLRDLVSKAEIREIARERVEKLLNLSQNIFLKDPNLAKRYLEISLNVAKRVNLRLPLQAKLRICKKCLSPMIVGSTCRVRIRAEHGSKLVVTCLKCGHVRRMPLRGRKSRGDKVL